MDCPRWQVRYLGEPLSIHRKSFDLLMYLLERRDRVVSKDELFRAIWPDQFVEENNLSQQISLLRKVLSQHDSQVRVIETIPGRGYRFLPAVDTVLPADSSPASQPPEEQLVLTAHESVTRFRVHDEIEAEAEITEGNASHLPLPGRRRRVWPLAAGAAVALVLLAGIGTWVWRHYEDHSSGAPVQVVLMPLQGTTGDAVLDRALSEKVRGDLLQSPFVSVVPGALVTGAMQHMQRKETEPPDLATAREVCERTNSQAVVQSTLARVGGHFLLTGDATGCVDGATVGVDSQEASRAEELLGAIGRLTNALRRKLGESRSSIARFNGHVTEDDFANTASLEALKAESEASRLNHAGKFTEAILMSQRAIALDPKFAGAFYDLGVNYGNLNDEPNERKALTAAYNLRASSSPMFQATVTARYQAVVTGDLFAAERNAVGWTEMYPRSVLAWNSLTNIETELGKIAGQKDSAEHALAVRPDIGPLYYNLAEAQRSMGDAAAARATLQHAIASGIDGEPMHMGLLRIAFATNDEPLYRDQQAWLAEHPHSPSLVQIFAEIAVAEGRFREARQLAARAREIELQSGEANAADVATKTIARELIGAGDREAGAAMFRSVAFDPEDQDDVVTLASLGDFDQADQLMAQKLAHFPENTLANRWYGPMIRAQEDTAAGKFQDATDVLEPTRPFDDRSYTAAILRGNARLAAGQPQLAEAEYRRVIAGTLNDSVSYTIPLAWLGLARSLVAEGNRTGASEAYGRFMTLWANADPEAALLRQARQETLAIEHH